MPKDKKKITKSETKITKKARPLGNILEDINSYLKKFIFMERIDRKLLCVFVAYSYIWDRFNYAVYILLHSAEKRCGKTRMQVHLAGLIRNPMKTSGGTAAAYLRVVAHKKPVLLIDELDKALKNDSSADNDLLQMLNSGVEKDNPIIKCIQNPKTKKIGIEGLDPFCPKVMGMIGGGQLDDTTRDRSIMIQMHRKTPEETKKYNIIRDVDQNFEKYEKVRKEIRADLTEWAETTQCDETIIKMPDGITNDRSFNTHEMLMKIGSEAGEDWYKIIEKSLFRIEENEEPYIPNNVQCLIDLSIAFKQNNIKGTDELKLTELVEWLLEDDFIESPWQKYGIAPITTRGLKKLLQPYGLNERRTNSKRYWLAQDFMDQFKRYVDPAENLSQLSLTSQNDTNAPDTAQLGEVTQVTEVTNSENTNRVKSIPKPNYNDRYDPNNDHLNTH